jgi:membrane-bound lytic murein transglycosylase F
MLRSYSIIVLLFFLVMSCSQEKQDTLLTTPQVSIDLDSIRQRGYLTALVDNNSFSYFLYKGQPMGYDYELLTRLAQHLNVKLKLKLVSGVETAIRKLNAGEGDVLAFPLTITPDRLQYVRFSKPHFTSRQVLVQRKPEGWETMPAQVIQDSLLTSVYELSGQTVHVINASSFVQRLQQLSLEIGSEIVIVEDSANAETESLIKQVALGAIDYTATDQVIAAVNHAYYPNLDVNTVLSSPQQIAWALRKNSLALQQEIDGWLSLIKKQPTFMVIYNRYFKSPRTSLLRASSKYATINGNQLSRYDDLMRAESATLGWDWRLLAAVVYQESRFINKDISWAGARGLMQLMPTTAQRFGASNPDDPTQNIRAGVRFLKHLDQYWEKKIKDSTERLKFVLASYNVGLTHIIDATRLAIKHNENPTEWSTVERYLLQKSKPAFYKDPVVIAGYCKCEEPVNYVHDVVARFEEYKMHVQ